MPRPLLALVALLVPAAALAPASAAAPAAPPDAASAGAPAPAPDDMATGLPARAEAKPLPIRGTADDVAGAGAPADRRQRRGAAAVGEERTWLAYDEVGATDYLKDFTLRGVGEHIEVWVASDDDGVSAGLGFPAGDCRNDERTQVTDAQVQRLIREFSETILPVESAAFSVAPERDGTAALLAEDLALPADYWRGEGDNTVVLVDNIRDANFGDLEGSPTFIAGFFTAFYNEAFDRNVITVDGFDWLHRTGANPPDEPVPGDPCASSPARPFGYEGVFAHEYQHLLQSYEDPAETIWLDEGLSMYAETITGYSDPSRPVDVAGFEALTQCFLGFGEVPTAANPDPTRGGPENSLTLWGDQGEGDEILCDYGAVSTMVHHLAGRFGERFVTSLHRDDGQGLVSLDALVAAVEPGTTALDLVHDWAAMVALDAPLDDGTGELRLGRRRRLTAPALDASVNWDNDDAWSTPGAPPNGSDYVRLRDGAGEYLRRRDLRTLTFDGASTLPASPVEWEAVADPEGRPSDPALWSGTGPDLDRAVIASVEVPAADPTLTFDSLVETEEGWDFGFVQVSTDGGETWTSLANSSTTSATDPTADPTVLENLPGFTGSSGGWTAQRFDLGAHAGAEVLLAFRYVSDSAVDGGGWWIDDVAVGGTPVTDGSTLTGLRSATEVRPERVGGFTVQLVGYRSSGRGPAFARILRLNKDFDDEIDKLDQRLRRRGVKADVVAAIVTHDDPTERVEAYAPYVLTVNGVVQPGGSAPAPPSPASTTVRR